MANLGVLTLDLVLKLGGYTEGLDKAGREAEKRSKEIQRSLNEISVTAIAVGSTIGQYLKQGIDTVVSLVPQLIDSVAKFQDLAEETGASAVGLASYAKAAAGAGVAMESIGAASIKLTKSLVGVDDESKAAGAALTAIGIEVTKFKKLAPEDQYEAIGKALAGFADGAGKTAIATALFGKAGAEQLKVFKALEEQGGRQTKLTAELIRLADEYGDASAVATAKLQEQAQILAISAVPALTAVKKAIVDVAGQLLNLQGGASELRSDHAILDWAEGAATAIATVGEAITALLRLIPSIGGSFKAVAADVSLGAGLAAGSLQVLFGRKTLQEAQADFEQDLAKRNKTLAEANKGYVDLWTYNGTAASEAIKKSFAAQRAALVPLDAEAQRRRNRLEGGSLPQINFEGSVKTPKTSAKESEYSKLNKRIQESIDLLQAELAATKPLTEGQKTHLKTIQDIEDARGKLSTKEREALTIKADERKGLADALDARKKEEDLLKANAAIIEKNIESALKGLEIIEKQADAMAQSNESLREEIAGLGLSESSRSALAAAIEEEALARRELDLISAQNIENNEAEVSLIEREIRLRKDRISLLRQRSEAQSALDATKAQQDAARKAEDDWKRATEQINESLTDALLRGFESGKGFAENFRDTLKNMFSTLVLRPIISGILSPISGGISSAFGAGGGAGNLMNAASFANTGYNLYQGALGPNSTLYNIASSKLGQSMGWSNSTAIAGNNPSAYMPAGTSPNFGAMFGSAAAIAVIVASAIEVFNATKGETRSGGEYAFDVATRKSSFVQGPSGGDGSAEDRALTETLITSTVTGIEDALKTLGQNITVDAFRAAYESSEQGRGGVFAGGTLSSGVMFGESGQGSNYDWTGPLDSKFEQWSNDLIAGLRNNDLDGSPQELAIDLQQSFVEAIQASFGIIPRIVEEKFLGESPFAGSQQGDSGNREAVEMSRWVRVYDEEMQESIRALGLMPKRLMDLILDVDPEALSAEATTKLTETLSTLFANVKGFQEIVAGLPVPELRDASFDFAAGLVELQKGLEPAAANISAYADNFYSAEEKRAQAVKNITKVLNEAGLAVTEAQVGGANREQFRAVAEQFAAMGEDGLKVYSALLSVNGAFASITEAADAAVVSLKEMRESVLSQFADIADRLLSPSQLRQFNVQRIQSDLAGKGFSVEEGAIDALTKDSLTELLGTLRGLGDDGLKATDALLSVSGSILDMVDAARALEAADINREFGDLAGALEEMGSPLKTLVEQWRESRDEAKAFADELDAITGAKLPSLTEVLAETLSIGEGLLAARAGIQDRIEDLRIRTAAPAVRGNLAQLRIDRLTQSYLTEPTAEALSSLADAFIYKADITSEAEIELSEKANKKKLEGLEKELDATEKLLALSKNMDQILGTLRIGELSPLSPMEQLNEARRLFETSLAGARTNDPQAVENFQTNLQAYLQEALEYFGRATKPFANVFEQVTNAARTLGLDSGDGRIQTENERLTAAIEALQNTSLDNGARQLEAYEKLIPIIDEGVAANKERGEDQLQAARQLVVTMEQTRDELQALIRQSALEHADVIELTERQLEIAERQVRDSRTRGSLNGLDQ